jgi:hypothetical protein
MIPPELVHAVLTSPSPFADPVVRLDPDLPAPPDVATIHAGARAAVRDAIATVAAERRAAMVLVTGDPGQGKTHLLAQLRRASSDAHEFTCIDVPPLKDAGAPFSHVLRYAVQGLAVAGHLTRVCWDLLRRIAAAVLDDARAHDDEAVIERVEQVLLGGDRFVGAFRTLAQQDPGLGAVLYQRGRHLAPLNGVYADLGRVVCRITDRDVEPAIIDWLRGAELPDDDLARLGVRHGVEDEAAAFEVLRSLAIVAPRPLVLCLDQIESTSGLLGPTGVARLFTALMELYQQAPVCIVLMCQTQQWSELRRDVPLAAVDRVRILPPLAKPTTDEAIAVVASRLAPRFEAAQVAPPYATWPLPAAFLADLVARRRPTIRQVLLECDELVEAMRRAGGVVEPKATDDAPPPPAPQVDRDVALRAARDKYIRSAAETMPTPGFRQDLLRGAVLDVLRGAQRLGRPLGGVTVAAVVAPPKPDRGPPPPPIVTLDGPGGHTRLAFEVHSDDPRAAHKVLQRLAAIVDEGRADLAVLIREAEVPIAETARASHELAARLAERGGGVVYIDRGAVLRLVGAEKLLDAAGASEVLVGDDTPSRDDALAFLLDRDDLGAALVPLVSRASTTPPRGHARAV